MNDEPFVADDKGGSLYSAHSRNSTRERQHDRTSPNAPLQVFDRDDPRVVRSASTEDYALHVAPLTWRSGRTSLLMAWYAFASAMFWLIIGATVALVVGTVDTLVGLVLSVIAYSVIGGIIGRYAARTGISSALFSAPCSATWGRRSHR